MSQLINIAQAKQLRGPFQAYCAERYLVGKDVKLGPWTKVGSQVNTYHRILSLITRQPKSSRYTWRVKQV